MSTNTATITPLIVESESANIETTNNEIVVSSSDAIIDAPPASTISPSETDIIESLIPASSSEPGPTVVLTASSSDTTEKNEPKGFPVAEDCPGYTDLLLCSLSQVIMVDPVITLIGHSYSRQEITQWLEKRKSDPNTNMPLESIDLINNEQGKQFSRRFLDANPHLWHSDEVELPQSYVNDMVRAIINHYDSKVQISAVQTMISCHPGLLTRPYGKVSLNPETLEKMSQSPERLERLERMDVHNSTLLTYICEFGQAELFTWVAERLDKEAIKFGLEKPEDVAETLPLQGPGYAIRFFKAWIMNRLSTPESAVFPQVQYWLSFMPDSVNDDAIIRERARPYRATLLINAIQAWLGDTSDDALIAALLTQDKQLLDYPLVHEYLLNEMKKAIRQDSPTLRDHLLSLNQGLLRQAWFDMSESMIQAMQAKNLSQVQQLIQDYPSLREPAYLYKVDGYEFSIFELANHVGATKILTWLADNPILPWQDEEPSASLTASAPEVPNDDTALPTNVAHAATCSTDIAPITVGPSTSSAPVETDITSFPHWTASDTFWFEDNLQLNPSCRGPGFLILTDGIFAKVFEYAKGDIIKVLKAAIRQGLNYKIDVLWLEFVQEERECSTAIVHFFRGQCYRDPAFKVCGAHIPDDNPPTPEINPLMPLIIRIREAYQGIFDYSPFAMGRASAELNFAKVMDDIQQHCRSFDDLRTLLPHVPDTWSLRFINDNKSVIGVNQCAEIIAILPTNHSEIARIKLTLLEHAVSMQSQDDINAIFSSLTNRGSHATAAIFYALRALDDQAIVSFLCRRNAREYALLNFTSNYLHLTSPAAVVINSYFQMVVVLARHFKEKEIEQGYHQVRRLSSQHIRALTTINFDPIKAELLRVNLRTGDCQGQGAEGSVIVVETLSQRIVSWTKAAHMTYMELYDVISYLHCQIPQAIAFSVALVQSICSQVPYDYQMVVRNLLTKNDSLDDSQMPLPVGDDRATAGVALSLPHYYSLPIQVETGSSFSSLFSLSPLCRSERLKDIITTLLEESDKIPLLRRHYQLIRSITTELTSLQDLINDNNNPSLVALFTSLRERYETLSRIFDPKQREIVIRFIMRVVSLFQEGDLSFYESSKLDAQHCEFYINRLLRMAKTLDAHRQHVTDLPLLPILPQTSVMPVASSSNESPSYSPSLSTMSSSLYAAPSALVPTSSTSSSPAPLASEPTAYILSHLAAADFGLITATLANLVKQLDHPSYRCPAEAVPLRDAMNTIIRHHRGRDGHSYRDSQKITEIRHMLRTAQACITCISQNQSNAHTRHVPEVIGAMLLLCEVCHVDPNQLAGGLTLFQRENYISRIESLVTQCTNMLSSLSATRQDEPRSGFSARR